VGLVPQYSHLCFLWVKLEQSAGMDPLPTFYQHVTDQIFHDLVQQHFPLQLTESTVEANWLAHQKANAISCWLCVPLSEDHIIQSLEAGTFTCAVGAAGR